MKGFAPGTLLVYGTKFLSVIFIPSGCVVFIRFVVGETSVLLSRKLSDEFILGILVVFSEKRKTFQDGFVELSNMVSLVGGAVVGRGVVVGMGCPIITCFIQGMNSDTLA